MGYFKILFLLTLGILLKKNQSTSNILSSSLLGNGKKVEDVIALSKVTSLLLENCCLMTPLAAYIVRWGELLGAAMFPRVSLFDQHSLYQQTQSILAVDMCIELKYQKTKKFGHLIPLGQPF